MKRIKIIVLTIVMIMSIILSGCGCNKLKALNGNTADSITVWFTDNNRQTYFKCTQVEYDEDKKILNFISEGYLHTFVKKSFTITKKV